MQMLVVKQLLFEAINFQPCFGQLHFIHLFNFYVLLNECFNFSVLDLQKPPELFDLALQHLDLIIVCFLQVF